MNWRKEIYLTIGTAIKAMDGAPITHVDLEKGQFSVAPKNYPIPRPYTTIEIKNLPQVAMHRDYQRGEVQVIVSTYFNNHGETFMDYADKEATLVMLDLMDKIIDTLIWKHGECFKPLRLVDEGSISAQKQINGHTAIFETTVMRQLRELDHVSTPYFLDDN